MSDLKDRTAGPTQLGRLLPADMMAKLATRVRQQEHWLAIIRDTLPESLAARCLGCRFQEGQLIVYAESSAALFQLRFLREELEAALKRQGYRQIVRVTLRVAALAYVPATPIRKANVPSSDISNLLLASAPERDSDPLSSSLQRLGQTLAALHQKKGPSGSP